MLTGIFKKQSPKPPINPRFRAYGKARLDIARRAESRSDWDKLWKEPAFPFPFDWGEWWKQCIEYKVDDFPAEVGFFTDILGLPVVAFDPSYAMFTSPARDFFLAIVPAPEPGKSTPADALRIQFMVADIFQTVHELERRGIVFEQKPQPCEQGSSMFLTYFRTPHGLSVDLWGIVPESDQPVFAPEFEEEETVFPDQSSESFSSEAEGSFRWEEQETPVSFTFHEEEDEEDSDSDNEGELRFEADEEEAEEPEESKDPPETYEPNRQGYAEPSQLDLSSIKSWSTRKKGYDDPMEVEEEDDDDSLPPIEYVYEDDL